MHVVFMDTLTWLERLVAFDTTSRNSNLALIETIRDFLAQQGVPVWLSHNADCSKANLFATLPAHDGNTQGGIVLSGHTDVVPVDGQNWDSDPFVLRHVDDRVYGRGSCDMKGFIATVLAQIPYFLSLPRLKPLHLAFTYDEEVGCLGAPILLAALAARNIRPDGCIVGEPTGMHVVVAHKSSHRMLCRVHGYAAHSSLTPHGCNAIEHAAELICHIRALAEQYRHQGPYDPCFDVPYTTLSTNLIHGGAATNIIPAVCEFSYEFRSLPGTPVGEIQSAIDHYIEHILLPKMRSESATARVELEPGSSVPALEAAEYAAITALAHALTQDTTSRKVAYATEGGQFQEAGIPTVVCGPGSIEAAHKPNEFVMFEQLQRCERFLRGLAISLCKTT